MQFSTTNGTNYSDSARPLVERGLCVAPVELAEKVLEDPLVELAEKVLEDQA
jgi:hypothetical protein